MSRLAPIAAAVLLLPIAAPPAGAQDDSTSYSPVYVADSPAAQEQIAQSQRLLDEQRPLDAAAALQPVIETMADKLIALDSGVYVSAARWVEDHVRSDPRLLEAYRTAFGPVAERQWITAQDRLDEQAIAAVFDQYGLTDAGLAAGLALAALRLEAADADAAQAVLDRLPRLHPVDALGERYQLLAGIAAALVGDTQAAAAHRANLEAMNAADALAQLDALTHRIHPPSRLSRPQPAPVSLPDAANPLWSIKIEDDNPAGQVVPGYRYRSSQGARWLGSVPVVAPRADGGRDVLVNTGEAVVAVDRVSGWQRWVYRHDDAIDPTNLPPQLRIALQRSQPLLDRRAVLVMGERVLGVLGDAIYSSLRRQPELRMTELVCLDRETGKAQWSLTPERVDPTLRQCFFLGTPISDGQRVYVAARRYRTSGFLDSFLLAIDPDDGSLIWRRHLSSLATQQRGEQAPPVEMLLREGRLYVHDCAAMAAALDARSGRALWLRVLVEATELPAARRTLRSRRSDEAVSPLVLVDAGLIVPQNNEAGQTLLIDPDTGALLRRLDEQPWDNARVLADAGANVLTLGDHATLWDGRTLKMIWSTELDGNPPDNDIGRPQVTARHVIISTRRGIRVLDLDDAELVATLPADAPGNVVAVDGQVLLATSDRLSSYLDWSQAYAELRRRAAESPADPRQGVALAHLAMNADEADAVIEGADQALAALRRNVDQPQYDALQALVFDQLMRLGQPARGADLDLRRRLYDRLRGAAATDTQRVAYHFAAADLAERSGDWSAAVEHYQVLLGDEQLASLMHRRDALVQRTGDSARRKLERLIDRQGPAVYRLFAAEAARRLAALGEGAEPAELVRLAERYPLAPASPRALLSAARRYEARGDQREATRQLRRAYPRADEPAVVAEVAGRLAGAYEQQGLIHRAAQWLRRVQREHPGVQPIRESQPIEVDAWLTLLRERSEAELAGELPTLHAASGGFGRAQRAEGRLLWPTHADAVAPPRDRFILTRDAQLSLHTIAQPDRALWTQDRPAPDAALLTHDEEGVLLWSQQQSRLWAIDAQSGEPAWPSVDVREQLARAGDSGSRAALMPPEQQRFMAMIHEQRLHPRQGPAEPDAAQQPAIRTMADESVVCMVDEAGRMMGVDRWSGRVLWSAMTDLDRVGPSAMGNGVVAVSGVVGEGTMAQGGGLLVLDAQTGEALFPLIEDRQPLSWLGVAPHGLLIAVGRGTVTAYNIETGQVAWRYDGGPTALVGRAWIEGRRMLALAEGGAVELLDLGNGQVLRRLPVSTSPRHVESIPQHAESRGDAAWLLLNNHGLTALGRDGGVRWRDAIGMDLTPPVIVAPAADVVVMCDDDGERTWVWCLDRVTGRIVAEHREPGGPPLADLKVLDGCVLIVRDTHLLVLPSQQR